MNFKSWVLLFLVGCGAFSDPDKIKKIDQKQFKTDTAFQSCEQLKIPGDIAFNGYFLYHFLLCSSDKTSEKQDALNGLSSIVQTMGVDGMDNMTSLLKEPFATDGKEKKYPLIQAMLVLLERGSYRDGKVLPDLFTRRFGVLQELLLELIPYWTVDLILDMNRTGKLKPLLDKWEVLFDKIDNQTFLSLIRTLLEDGPMRKSTAVLLEDLSQKDYYWAWKEVFNVSSYIPLSSNAISRCLDSWADPQITQEELSCHQNQYQENVREYPAESFQKLLGNLGEKKTNALVLLFDSLTKDFLNIPSSTRLSVIVRIFDAVKKTIATHQSPLRTYLSRINYFTKKDNSGRYQVDSGHTDILVSTLSNLIDSAGSEIGQVVNSKIGIVKLEEKMVDFFFQGGKIKGCDLSLRGMKDTDLTDRKEVFSLIYLYIAPHPRCRQGISPMASHSLAILQENLALDCNDKKKENFCPSENNMENMALTLQRVKWDDLASDQVADSALVKKLLLETMDEISAELSKDSHYLYWPRLAKGEVQTHTMKKLIEMVKERKDFSPGGVADFDGELKRLHEFDILQEDFLEKLLQFKINRLSAVLEQFDNIIDERRDANIKLERIFYGLYNQGPLEQLIHPRLYLGKLPGNIGKKISFHTPRVKDVLFQLRKEGMLFKNKYMVKGHNLNLPWPGIVGNSSRFYYDGQEGFFQGIRPARNPFSFADYFKSGSKSIHTLDDYALFSILQGHNVEKGRGEHLAHWIQEDFNHIFNDADLWYDYLSESSFSLIDNSYFDTTPYSFEEMRKLSLFYSLNFLYMPASLPLSETDIVHTMDRKWARRIPVMLSFQKKDTKSMHWSAFQRNYPDFLSKPSISFTDLIGELEDLTQEDFDIPWHELAKYTEEMNLEYLTDKQQEVLKILSTVNLFSVASDGFGTGRYIPVIGTAQECHEKKDEKLQQTSCPIVFLDSKSKQAFDSMRGFIQRRYLEQFCPLLFSGGGFSLNFVEYMQESLQLKIKNRSPKDYCSSIKNKNALLQLPDGSPREYTIPRIFHEKILNDLFKMGKNPRLASGLSTLVGQIRFAKIMDYPIGNKKILAKNILNSHGFLPPLLRAYSHHILTDNQGFFVKDMNIIGKYLDFMNRFLNLSVENYFWTAVVHYGADSKQEGDLENSTFQRFLSDFVLPHYEQWSQKETGRPVLEFVIELFLKMDEKEHREYRRSLSFLLSRPESSYSISTWNLFLFFMLDDIKKNHSSSTKLFWDLKGVKLLQYITRKEFLIGFGEMLHPFDSKEIDAALVSFIKALKSMRISSYEIVDTLQAFTDFFTRWYMGAGRLSEPRIYPVEKSLQSLLSQNRSIHYYDSVDTLLQKTTESLKDFEGNSAMPLSSHQHLLIDYMLKNLIDILHIHQEHFEKNGMKTSEDYVIKLMSSLVKFLQSHNQEGFSELVFLLGDERMGTWKKVYRKILFEEKTQSMIVKLLKDLAETNREDFVKLIEEMDILLPRIHPMAKFIDDHLIPQEDVSVDVIESIKTLRRISNPQNPIWPANRDVLHLWLKNPNDSR